jgi:hypothetical protein
MKPDNRLCTKRFKNPESSKRKFSRVMKRSIVKTPDSQLEQIVVKNGGYIIFKLEEN